MTQPDGRPLHGYRLTDGDMAAFRPLLRTRIAIEERLGSTAQAFVLWAAERIRRDWPGGVLTWEFVYQGLGCVPPDYAFTRWLVETGLRAWRRPLRRGEAGHREFLYSLLAEGGLPDAALAHANSYQRALAGLIRDLESEGALAAAAAQAAGLRAVLALPQVLRDADQARLMAELALALIALREALPDGLPPEAATGWLDANRPDWRAGLPLRLSDRALTAIVRPALMAERPRPPVAAAPLRRSLLRDDAGIWHGAAEIVEGAFLPASALPDGAQGLRLRLVAENGATFLALPEPGGWRLTRTGGRVLWAANPQEPVVLAAHADGRHLGEVLLDAGLPAPDEAPSLWHSPNPAQDDPEELVPLSGRGRTRAARLFLLAPADPAPQAGEGLTLGAPQPGPGGRLWPIAGKGTVDLGSRTMAVETGAETGAPEARLVALGPMLPGLRCADGTPVHLGMPQILGAEGEAPLRPLTGTALRLTPLPRRLGGQIAAWTEGGAVLARLRLVLLPQDTRLAMQEIAAGTLRLAAEGLEPGRHLALAAGDATARVIVDTAGRADMTLTAQGTPGIVTLRLSDPVSGEALDLVGLWPARAPRLIDPEGEVLRQERKLSLARLAGWRGHLPSGNGAVLLRLGGQGAQVGFAAAGDVRPAAFAPILGQALALTGADGRVNLRLALGEETPHLSIARYDWQSEEAGPFRHLGAGRTRLAAVCLDDPARTARTEAEGRIDLAGWLGEGEGLWFIQGENDRPGVMRPFVWAARPQPRSTRDERLARYARDWAGLLAQPEDPAWDRQAALIGAVRAAGDCGALDQVQALALVPAAAVALLLLARREGRAAALALETEAPIWWPLVPAKAWAQGAMAALNRLQAQLAEAGLADADEITARSMARAAGEIVALRPEIAAHLGHALKASGLAPEARDGQGAISALLPPAAAARVLLDQAAQEAARRFDALPQGVEGLRAARLAPPGFGDGRMDALLHAPFVVAEAASGLRPALGAPEVLRLLALRAADPTWFEAALPSALTLALTESRA